MKRLNKVFLVLFLAVVGFLAVQPKAEAVKVILDNRRSQKVFTSLVYYDVNQGSWCCRGWWGVKPHSRRSINIPHDSQERIYYYAKDKGGVVHGRTEGWARWDVISNVFKYYEYDGCPHGRNFRSVYFNCSETPTYDSWTLHIN